eukprot:1349084-Amorphochlora_amoeboformis.AAC.1
MAHALATRQIPSSVLGVVAAVYYLTMYTVWFLLPSLAFTNNYEDEPQLRTPFQRADVLSWMTLITWTLHNWFSCFHKS